MIFALFLMFLAWFVAVLLCLRLRNDIRGERNLSRFYKEKWQSSAKSDEKLDTAMKQIAELRGQVPGRDKTGRFVKKRECGSHGAE